MNQHSNGPWKLGHRVNLVISENGGSIAHCYFTHSNSDKAIKPTVDQCVANANLISAAPEMLKVLQEVVGEQFDNEARYGYGLVTIETLNEARAAIAKALGR